MTSSVTVRFMRRSPAERRLLVTTAALFLVAHALLRWASLPTARTRLQRSAHRLRARAADVGQLQWCVHAVAGTLPGTHACLVQALCCEAIAGSSGIEAEFRIGAARALDAPRHRFHAWVEHQGRVIVGHHTDGFVALA